MLLVEYTVLDKLQVINEGTAANKRLRVRGVFQKCDEQNNNGRVYPRKILESQVKAIQEKIGDRSLVGALDHPANDAIHLSQASHLITKLWVEKGGQVMGEAEILSTPNGKIVEALLQDNVKIGISSRGLGSVSEGTTGKVVNEDFKLITFDLVSDPSTKGAFPSMCESMRENSERAQAIVSKHKKDRVLMTMLESKIKEALNEGLAGEVPDIPANTEVLATKKMTAADIAAFQKRGRTRDAARQANTKTPDQDKRQQDRILSQPQGRAVARKAAKKPVVPDRNSTNLRNFIVDRLKSVYEVNSPDEHARNVGRTPGSPIRHGEEFDAEQIQAAEKRARRLRAIKKAKAKRNRTDYSRMSTNQVIDTPVYPPKPWNKPDATTAATQLGKMRINKETGKIRSPKDGPVTMDPKKRHSNVKLKASTEIVKTDRMISFKESIAKAVNAYLSEGVFKQGAIPGVFTGSERGYGETPQAHEIRMRNQEPKPKPKPKPIPGISGDTSKLTTKVNK